MVPQVPEIGIEARDLDSSLKVNYLLCLQRKLLSSCCLYEKDHHISVPFPDISHYKRTQPSHPEARFPSLSSQRHGGPEFSFDLLPEAQAIQVTIAPGPEVSMHLCHQWTLECKELSSPFSAQMSWTNGSRYTLLTTASPVRWSWP